MQTTGKSVDEGDAAPARARTPIHIYVLWHPALGEKGRQLAGEIYRWFRLDNMEGIPVFFRSPALGAGRGPMEIHARADIHYVIPLVDANMAADPAWREYLVGLSKGPRDSHGPKTEQMLLPVAMDEQAYQVPAELRSLNFIRHEAGADPERMTDALLSVLTEVMCRHLRYRVARPRAGEKGESGKQEGAPRPPSKIKIFLSHAKADGTDVAQRLKAYIQTRTQCETFFDETDIPSGHDYRDKLNQTLGEDAAGMLVIHGAQYAERPWCRREIRMFQEPRPDPHAGGKDSSRSFFVPPVVVVENMTSDRVTRSIPELGYSPAVRWAEGAERRIVNTLLREMLLGFFYRLLAMELRKGQGRDTIFLNRAPDPLLVQRLLKATRRGRGTVRRVVYPGYGLTRMELASLTDAFGACRFVSMSEVEQEPAMASTLSMKDEDSLAGQVVRLSVGTSTDILEGGYGDQHNQELVLRMFRPLVQRGVSILHGGLLPNAVGALAAWEENKITHERFVNFTSACLHMLVAERANGGDGTGTGDGKGGRGGVRVPEPRLYNMPAWPNSEKVHAVVRAQWVDVCTFRTVGPEDLFPGEPHAGQPWAWLLKPEDDPGPFAKERSEYDTLAEWREAGEEHERKRKAVEGRRKVIEACCLSRMRQLACGEGPNGMIRFDNMNPQGGKGRNVCIRPLAHVLLGGRLAVWGGVAPGLFEEFAFAVGMKRPVFLIGAGRGAAGAIARWLVSAVSGAGDVETPREFTVAGCLELARPAGAKRNEAAELDDALKTLRAKGELPAAQWDLAGVLGAVAKAVAMVRDGSADLGALFRNGLTHDKNLTLIRPETGHGEICKLVHQGLETLATKGRRDGRWDGAG